MDGENENGSNLKKIRPKFFFFFWQLDARTTWTNSSEVGNKKENHHDIACHPSLVTTLFLFIIIFLLL